MRTIIFFFFLFSFSFSQEEKRLALVIGNSEYTKGPLKNPVNDATLIAETLEKLDFEVILHKNLKTRSSMLKAISEFGQLRPMYDIGFIYYAGHGIQVNNENYLIPTEEIIDTKLEVEDYAVSLQKILRYVESTDSNKINFLVLDACRDNPYELSWSRSSKGNGLAKVPPPTGSLIAFSTDSNQTAADGEGENSLYTKSLAKNLMAENISIEQVFKNVLTEVLVESDNMQSPVYESKLTGSTYSLNKTFSIYDASIDEIFEFANSKIKENDLAGGLSLLNDAANFYKSQENISAEINSRFQILKDYIFYNSEKGYEEIINSEKIHINYVFAENFRKMEEVDFESRFDEISYDIFVRNLTYLISNSSKEYLKKINYNDLMTLYSFHYYQHQIFLINNETIDYNKYLKYDLMSMDLALSILEKNNIELEMSSPGLFWLNKFDLLEFRNYHYNEFTLVQDFEEIDNYVKDFTIKYINKLRGTSSKISSNVQLNKIDEKVNNLSLKKYKSVSSEIERQIHDIFYYTSLNNSKAIENEFFEAHNQIHNILTEFNSHKKFNLEFNNENLVFDLPWYFYSLIAYFANSISNEEFEIAEKVKILLDECLIFLSNYDSLISEIKSTRDQGLINSYNNFAISSELRTDWWAGKQDYRFLSTELIDDNLLGQKADKILNSNKSIRNQIELYYNIYNNVKIDNFSFVKDEEIISELGRLDLYFYLLSKDTQKSNFGDNQGFVDPKIFEYEKKLKINYVIKNHLLDYFSFLENEANIDGSTIFNVSYSSKNFRLIQNLIALSEIRGDEYLILKFFELKQIFMTVKHSTFAWEIDDIILKYQNLIELSESKDDYLFRINVDQTFKQFISDFPYEKYRKVYDTQQLEEKINKLEKITNQT